MDVGEFYRLYGVTDADLARVRKFSVLVAPKIDEFVEKLYEYMRFALDADFEIHFPDEAAVARAQAAARRGWLELLKAAWDDDYVESRLKIGEVHAQLQIEPRHYLATLFRGFELLTEEIYDGGLPEPEVAPTFASLRRVIKMEGAFVVDVYSRRTSEIIARQSRALTDMSTPITALWEGVLMLPVVGIVDSRRAQDIMQRMLERIAEKRAVVFILDISGVAIMDTAVANHLIRMTKAARLMGAYTIVSGLSPAVAQTIVELGIDVGEMRTTGNLQDALRLAFQQVGLERKLENQ